MEQKPWVVFLEDDRDDRELISLCLGAWLDKADVTFAEDGARALEVLSSERRPALVVLDLKVPKLGGLDVLRRLRSDDSRRAIPIVVFSSSAEPGDVGASWEAGANSFVQKPLNHESFRKAVRGLLDYWLELNHRP